MENKSGRCSFMMNGQKIELIFGMPAMEQFVKKMADGHIAMDEKGEVYGNSSIASLLMAGYCNNCIYNDLPIKLKTGDFLDFLQENEESVTVQTELNLIGECFKSSSAVIKFLDRIYKAAEQQKKRILEILNQPSDQNGMLTGNP